MPLPQLSLTLCVSVCECVSVCVHITLGVRSRHHLLVNGLTNTCTHMHAEFPCAWCYGRVGAIT